MNIEFNKIHLFELMPAETFAIIMSLYCIYFPRPVKKTMLYLLVVPGLSWTSPIVIL